MKTRMSLAGVQYCDYAIANLKVGMKLELYPESSNAYDKRAIAVYAGDHKIGYIKKGELQSAIWKAKSVKKKVTTKLVGYHKNNPTWYMLTVEVDVPIILDEPKFEVKGNQTYKVTGDGSCHASWQDIKEHPVYPYEKCEPASGSYRDLCKFLYECGPF